MDISGAIGQINDITTQVNTYIEKINAIKEKYVVKINETLDELEEAVNSAATKSVVWVEMKVAKLTKKLQTMLDSFAKKIQDIIKQLSEWFDKQINAIKISTIKGAMAKLGVECDTTMAEGMSSMIPSPSIESLLPEIKIELQLPNLSNLADVGEISLPRL